MTKRTPVSALKNIWSDSQQVDDTDLTLEQEYNDTIESSTISNHIGAGILPEVLVQNILFDSTLQSGFLDGVAISTQNQPADNNFGNQLEVTLENSKVAGRKTVKVAVIGLDFQSNLQYETFTFKTNEVQIGKKHFTEILLLLFNDFVGDPNLSMNLGGRIVIKEARPLSLSRAPVMVAQDQQPNLFFRDFFVSGTSSLNILLKNALPLYNTDTLDIFTANLDQKAILSGDVTTIIGEKFIATTTNIQKVSLLLSVRNLIVGSETDLVWNGDLVVSIYPLQSTLDCPTDIAPNLPIDFSPSNIPLAQISVNYTSLQATGIVLDSVPQPVDFVFSNSPIASGNILTAGNFYVVAIKRAGAANKCDILIDTGGNLIPNSRITTFTGSLWVDLPEEQLWFQVWTDAAKVSDGQAYESGHGIIVPKTTQDPTTLATIDYSKDAIQFAGNEVFRAVVAAATEESVPVPDQRTGNPVLTRQQFVPNIELLNTLDIVNLQKASEPLLIGAISDKNRKFYDSISSLISSTLYSATVIGDEMIIRIIDDTTDGYRYDTSVVGLQSNLLLGDFIGAQIIPNATNATVRYRIADARLCSYLVGDVDGNGIIDERDLELLTSYLGTDLTLSVPTAAIVTTDGINTTYTNGYLTETQPFTNLFTVNFQLVDPDTTLVVASGSDGVLVANPNDPRLAQFTSSSVNFNVIMGLSDYKLVVNAPGNDADHGGFDIVSIDSVTDVLTIRKTIQNGETISQMLRSDIDGDFHITTNDGYLLGAYIDRENLSFSPTAPYPAPSTNAYTKIGTPFNVIRFKVEKFVDRTDDYSTLTVGRPTVVHEAPDMFLADGYFASHNYLLNPTPFTILKQLVWDESLIVSNSHPRFVPSIFSNATGFTQNACQIEGINCNVYGSQPAFDPGTVNFFTPNNIIIGEGGELQRPDGEFYKVDFEVGTIILEIPDGLFGSERTINIMDDFISDYTGQGITRLGFPAMRFADCSFVHADALAKDQVRFSVAVQSFSPNNDGYSNDGYFGVIVDGKMGVSVDYATGLLTLNFSNLYEDAVLQTLSTKIQVHVYLKKSGFNNKTLFVDSVKVQNMLQLISVFSGANVGGPSALVNLEFDVTGILPIIHGGTGLDDVGPFGTVLVSNGTGLNYQFVNTLINVIAFSTGSASADKVPKTDGYGFLDPSFMYKQPLYIPILSGVASHDNVVPVTIGGFTFRYDSFILEGLDSITLEVILESTDPGKTAEVLLFDNANNAYITLTSMSTTNTSASLLRSQDLKALFNAGASDFVYEVQLRMTPNNTIPETDTAICKMARLVMTYNNLSINGAPDIQPPVAHSWNFVPYLPSPTPI